MVWDPRFLWGREVYLGCLYFEVTARSADSPNAPARLTQPLPGGTEVKVIEDRNDWLRVRLYDGRDAWLPATSVRQIGG